MGSMLEHLDQQSEHSESTQSVSTLESQRNSPTEYQDSEHDTMKGDDIRGKSIAWANIPEQPKLDQESWKRWLAGYQNGNHEEEGKGEEDEVLASSRNNAINSLGDMMVRTSDGQLVSSFDFFMEQGYVASPPLLSKHRRQRDAALLRHQLDQTFGNNILDTHCQQAKVIFNVEFSAVSLAQIDSEEVQILGATGCNLEEIVHSPLPRSSSICSHAFLLGERSAMIRNRSKDWRLRNFEFGPSPSYHKQSKLGFNFYASAPLMLSAPALEGQGDVRVQVGRFCIMNLEEKESFGEADVAQLEAMAKMAADALEREWESRRAMRLLKMQNSTIELTTDFHSKFLVSPSGSNIEDDVEQRTKKDLQTLFQKSCDQILEQFEAAGVLCFGLPAKRSLKEGIEEPEASNDQISKHEKKLQPELLDASQYKMTNSELHINIANQHSFVNRKRTNSDGEALSKSSSKRTLFASSGSINYLSRHSSKEQEEAIESWLSRYANDPQAGGSRPVVYRAGSLRQDYAKRYPEEKSSQEDDEAENLASLLPENAATFIVVPILDLDSSHSSYAIVIYWTLEYLVEMWDRNFLISTASTLQSACMRRNALESYNAKLRFMRLVSHEMRTPLHGIIGMSTQLQQCVQNNHEPQDDKERTLEQKDKVSKVVDLNEIAWLSRGIQFAGEDLRKILDDMLEYGRLNVGMPVANAETDSQERSLVDIVESSCRDHLMASAVRREHFGHQTVEVGTSPFSLPLVVTVADLDAERALLSRNSAKIRNLIDQFVSNAIRFSKVIESNLEYEEHPLIMASVRIIGSDGKNSVANITIEDNGIGMSAEFLQQFAEPFNKANTFHQGTGVGVALGYSTLEQLGGSMEVSSTEGKGTSVSLTFQIDTITDVETTQTQKLTKPLEIVCGSYPTRHTKSRKSLQQHLAHRNIHLVNESDKEINDKASLFFHDVSSSPTEKSKLESLCREACSSQILIIVSSVLDFDLDRMFPSLDFESCPWIYCCSNPLVPSALSSLINFLHHTTRQECKVGTNRRNTNRSSMSTANEAEYVEMSMSPSSSFSTFSPTVSSPTQSQLFASSSDLVPYIDEKASKSKGQEEEQFSKGDKERNNDFSVLLVEDNPINMRMLEACVKKTKCRYKKAYNGEEAVEMYKKMCPGGPSVVLLDISMPVMNGFEASKAMRTHDNDGGGKGKKADTRIVAVTALSSREDVDIGIQCGINEWRVKPANLPKLTGDLLLWQKEWESKKNGEAVQDTSLTIQNAS